MTVSERKQQIRIEQKARRKALTHEYRQKASLFASDLLFSSTLSAYIRNLSGVASYMSFGAEFPTDLLHQALFKQNVPLVIPYYQAENKAYNWVELTQNTPLVYGYMGIPEPSSPTVADLSPVTMAIIPGLTFDPFGGRIGYGAGIYDRLLLALPTQTLRIAVAFDCQVSCAPLPQDTHDLKMDLIITESQWIDCRANRKQTGTTYA